MEDKVVIIIAWNTFRLDLKTGVLSPEIRAEFDKRNASATRLEEISKWVKEVYEDIPQNTIPEELRLVVKEMKL